MTKIKHGTKFVLKSQTRKIPIKFAFTNLYRIYGCQSDSRPNFCLVCTKHLDEPTTEIVYCARFESHMRSNGLGRDNKRRPQSNLIVAENSCQNNVRTESQRKLHRFFPQDKHLNNKPNWLFNAKSTIYPAVP